MSGTWDDVNGVSGTWTAVRPATAAGSNNVISTGDPVSLASGEVHDPLAGAPDLFLGGPRPLYFRRYYAALLSSNGITGTLGNNWMHNFDFSLSASAGVATITVPGGRRISFQQQGTSWVLNSIEQVAHQLLSTAEGGYQFLDLSTELIYTFGADGRLTRIEDRNSNALTVTQSPTANGPLTVSDGLGRTLSFSYTGGKLTSVQDQTGRQVQFLYTGNDLTTFIDARGNGWSYAYTSAGGLNSLLSSTTNPAGNQPFTQAFDTQGRVVRQADGAGNVSSFSYGTQGEGSSSVTDPLNRTSQYVHPGFGNVSSVTDPDGDSDAYAYDANNHLTAVTNHLGQSAQFSYHQPSGYFAAVTEFLGRQVTVTYQQQDQGGFQFFVPTQITGMDGATIQMELDSRGNVVRFVDRAGATWLYTYNARGQVVTATNPAGAQATYSYNQDGTLAQSTAFDGTTQTYAYDSLKRLSSITNADGTSHLYQRDAANNIVRETDERGKAVTLAYDANNRLSTLADPSNNQRLFSYDANDRLTQVTDRLGNVHTYQYDAAGQFTQFRNAARETVHFTYGNRRELTAMSDSLGPMAQFVYDDDKRLTATQDGLGKTRSLTLDAAGRPVTHTLPGGQTITFAYTNADKLASAVDELGRTTQFQYDARGEVTGITHAGIAAGFERNLLNNVTAITDANGNRWTRQYDSAGREVARTDPLGNVISFTYDSRGRIQQITTPQGTITNQYDEAGHVLSQQLADGTTLQFTYDDSGKLLTANGLSLQYNAEGQIINSNGLEIARDPVGRVSSITVAPGKQITYAYDARGRVSKVADWVGGETVISYDLANRPTSIQRPNSTVTQFVYDANDRVTGITESNGSELSSIQLQRDAAGQIVSADRNVPLNARPARGVLALSYDAAHQRADATYDGNGRITADPLYQYQWDQASRLLSYAGANKEAQFTYDGLGARISRASLGTVEQYVLNYALGLPSIAVVRSGGADARYYVHLPNGILLHSIEASDNSRRFYHFDEMGSTIMLTDDNGAVTDSYASGPYGKDVRHNGPSSQPFVFHGAFGVMREGNTLLYYMRTRYYDAGSARFLSRDPVLVYDPLQLNPYQFAAGNPMLYGDPTGRTVILPGAASTGIQINQPCPPSTICYGSLFVDGGRFARIVADFRFQEYTTFARGFDAHFNALADGITDINQVERINRFYARSGRIDPCTGVEVLRPPPEKTILWYNENVRQLTELEKSATRWRLFSRTLVGVGIGLDAGLTIYDGVKHDDGVGTIAYDTTAVVAGDVAVLAHPGLAVADLVTLGGVSGGITNFALAPVDVCKACFSDRFRPADAERVKRRWTRKPLLGGVWWLGEKLADVIVD